MAEIIGPIGDTEDFSTVRNHLGRSGYSRIRRKSRPPLPTQHLVAQCRFSRLRSLGRPGTLLVMAMIACNDLTTLNYLNVKTDRARDVPDDVGQYMRHWTLRMLMLQLDQSLDLVHRLKSHPTFGQAFAEPDLASAFQDIGPFLRGGADRGVFEDRIGYVRDKLAAHIDEDAIRLAMDRRAKCPRRDIGKIELSTSMWCTRFYAAEDVLTTVMVRLAWGLESEGTELEKAANEISDWFIGLAEKVQFFLMTFLQVNHRRGLPR